MINTKSDKNLIICCVIYMISTSLFILLRIGGKFALFSFLGEDVNYILNSINQIFFIAMIPIFLYSLLNKQKIKRTFSDMKFSRIPVNMVGNSFLLGVITFGLVIIVSTIWSGVIGLTGYESPMFMIRSWVKGSPFNNFLISIVFTCLLPAFCEEIFLRGVVLSGLEKIGRKRTIIICGLLFGFLHLNIHQVLYTSLIGMLLTLITLMTKSIWPAIIIHFTSNFCSVFATFISELNLFNGQLNQAVSVIFQGSLFNVCLNIALLSIILIFLFITVFARFIKYGRSKNLYDKLQKFMKESALKDKAKVEINQQTGEALIKMRAIVEEDIAFQISNAQRPFDLILPPTQADKYKPTLAEKILIVSSLCLGGIATLVGFIGGIFLC